MRPPGLKGLLTLVTLCWVSLSMSGAILLNFLDVPAENANRPASESEEMRLLRAASFGLGAHGRVTGMRLSEVRVSTEDERWAAGRLILFNEGGIVEGNGLAVFQHLARGWSMDFYDFRHGGPGNCGGGASIPVPIPVQLDLRLPSCPLGGAKLGETPTVLAVGGASVAEPHSLTVETSTGTVTFVEIGPWETWDVNRDAQAKANGTLLESGTRKRVQIKLRRYRRCGGGVIFRRLAWTGLRHGEGVPGHHLALACPT